MPDREQIIKDLEFCVNGHFKVELSLATKVLALLKEQEEQIRKLTEEIEELRNKRNEVYYSGYDGSFIL